MALSYFFIDFYKLIKKNSHFELKKSILYFLYLQA